MFVSCCPRTDFKMRNTIIEQSGQFLGLHNSDCFPSKKTFENDVVDNPNTFKHVPEKFSESNIYFETMKCKKNRLDSFEGKWPLPFINFIDLAECGFFYLQLDDKVQCAFCKLILHSWQHDDEPLKEHVTNSPRCPFLTTLGNTTKSVQQRLQQPSSYCSKYVPLPLTSGPLKPKNPRMADITKRLLTFTEWPFPISAKDLAECGFYYTGTKDFVTCFSCGGSHGYWEPTDDPITEHRKFFPNCRHLRLLQCRPAQLKQEITTPPYKQNVPQPFKQALVEEMLTSDIVKQAKEIFPSSLVEDIVRQHLNQTGQTFSSLPQLCEKILERDEKRIQAELNSTEKGGGNKSNHQQPEPLQTTRQSNLNNTKDLLLCKICLDKDVCFVFQPCGHLVACEKCSALITECPLCRRPIESRVRTYLS